MFISITGKFRVMFLILHFECLQISEMSKDFYLYVFIFYLYISIVYICIYMVNFLFYLYMGIKGNDIRHFYKNENA